MENEDEIVGFKDRQLEAELISTTHKRITTDFKRYSCKLEKITRKSQPTKPGVESILNIVSFVTSDHGDSCVLVNGKIIWR